MRTQYQECRSLDLKCIILSLQCIPAWFSPFLPVMLVSKLSFPVLFHVLTAFHTFIRLLRQLD